MEPSWSQPVLMEELPWLTQNPSASTAGRAGLIPFQQAASASSHFPEDYHTLISLESSFPSPDQIKSSDRNPGNGCAAKDANFPLLITLPQPSTKLSFNSPLSQHKVRGRIPAECFNGLMLDPGRKDFNDPKGWIWVLS